MAHARAGRRRGHRTDRAGIPPPPPPPTDRADHAPVALPAGGIAAPAHRGTVPRAAQKRAGGAGIGRRLGGALAGTANGAGAPAGLQSSWPMQIETLWPPKPSEFDRALRILRSRASPGT